MESQGGTVNSLTKYCSVVKHYKINKKKWKTFNSSFYNFLIAGCKDKALYCDTYKHLCSVSKNFRKDKCPKTCDACMYLASTISTVNCLFI